MNSISDIMKGKVSAMLIALGYVLVWCGIFCLIGSAIGGAAADLPFNLLWCGWGCLLMGAIQIGSGIAWYYIVKPKS